MLTFLRARAADPVGVRTDSWSEANVVVSARNAQRNGWLRYGGVAQHQVDRPPFVNDPFYYYAHYPLGGYYVTWALGALGGESLPAWRWGPTLASLAGLICWYFLCCGFIDRWSALASTVVMGTAYGFLAYADNILQGYSSGLLLGMMLCFVTGLASAGRQRQRLLAISWLLLFLNSLTSWEWYLFSLIFCFGYWLMAGRALQVRWLGLFVAAPTLAFGIQSAVRRSAFGPEPGASVASDLLRRTIDLEGAIDTPAGVTLRTYPQYVLNRFEQFYGADWAMVCLLAILWCAVLGAFRDPAERAHRALRWALLLFVGGVSWWCIMLQHTAVHQHVLRHALYVYSLVVGVSVAFGFRVVFGRERRVWERAVGAALLLLVLWPHAARTAVEIRLHFDRSYVHPFGWSPGWAEALQLAELKEKLPSDVILLTNNNRLPLMRYWTDLPVYPGNLLRAPQPSGESSSAARLLLELSLSHVRQLYDGRSPRLVYVDFIRRDPEQTYLSDQMLWQLVDGTWDRPVSRQQVDNFGRLWSGQGGTSRHPLIASGTGWLAFDATELPGSLPADLQNLPPPTRADFGPPR